MLFLVGPGLFLLGAALFRWMATGRLDPRPVLVTVLLLVLLPLAPPSPIVARYAIVTALLGALAIEEVAAAGPLETRSPE